MSSLYDRAPAGELAYFRLRLTPIDLLPRLRNAIRSVALA
jgi:hypothetical protein